MSSARSTFAWHATRNRVLFGPVLTANPGRLLAPLPALVLQVIIANNIDETNTVMLEVHEVGQ